MSKMSEMQAPSLSSVSVSLAKRWQGNTDTLYRAEYILPL